MYASTMLNTTTKSLGLTALLFSGACATTQSQGSQLPGLVCNDAADCKIACEANDADACVAWALVRSSHNAEEADLAYARACELGKLDVCVLVAERLLWVKSPSANSRAVELLTHACNNNVARGCTQLGAMYGRGDVLTRSEERAATLYAQACKLSEATACTRLGAMHELGRAVTRDISKALEFYQSGCDSNHAEGCTQAGQLLIVGFEGSTTTDAERGLKLLHKGCEGGDQRACALIGDTK